MDKQSTPWCKTTEAERLELRRVMRRSVENPYMPYWREEEALIADMLHSAPPELGVALSVGCGYFRELPLLLSFNFEQVLGVDSSDQILAELSGDAGFRHPSAKAVHGYAEALPFEPGSIDAAFILFNSLGNFDKPESAIRESHRVLKPDGVLIISNWRTTEAARRFRVERYRDYPGGLLEVDLVPFQDSLVYRYRNFSHDGRELHSSLEFDETNFSALLNGMGFTPVSHASGDFCRIDRFVRQDSTA
jgi:SAM-dependent methyltransferase